ncbi:unnamed protein product [Prunus armeniaca]
MHKGMCKTRFQTVRVGTSSVIMNHRKEKISRMSPHQHSLIPYQHYLIPRVDTSYVIKNHIKEKMKSDEPSSTLPHPLSTLPHPK